MHKNIFEIEITHKFPAQAFLPLNLMTFAFLSCFHTTALKKHHFN